MAIMNGRITEPGITGTDRGVVDRELKSLLVKIKEAKDGR
jgi:hypothetical protein